MVGTDLFTAFLLTSVAAFGHFELGNVDILLMVNLLIGSVPGILMDTYGQFEKLEIPEFWATPVNGTTPCLFRAVYLVTWENDHWVYRLRPGSLEILPHQTALGDKKQLGQSAAT